MKSAGALVVADEETAGPTGLHTRSGTYEGPQRLCTATPEHSPCLWTHAPPRAQGARMQMRGQLSYLTAHACTFHVSLLTHI